MRYRVTLRDGTQEDVHTTGEPRLTPETVTFRNGDRWKTFVLANLTAWEPIR